MADDATIPPNPRSLAALIGLAQGDRPRWGAGDLADVLAHQLRAPLVFDLGRLIPAAEAAANPNANPGATTGGGIHSFADLLRHPTPPLALLVLTKDFAKSCDAGPDAAVPPEVATALYFAAIAAAIVRLGGRRITALSDRAIDEGLVWGLAQPWVDADTRALFGLARQSLSGGGPAVEGEHRR